MISKIIPEKEVTLYQNRLVTIILEEMADYENRRISKKTLQEILKTFWLVIINELVCGNNVTTPIGTFSLYVDRKLGQTEWEQLRNALDLQRRDVSG